MASRLSFGLGPAGSREEQPGHQALSSESRPQAWLQGGTPAPPYRATSRTFCFSFQEHLNYVTEISQEELYILDPELVVKETVGTSPSMPDEFSFPCSPSSPTSPRARDGQRKRISSDSSVSEVLTQSSSKTTLQ
ncbi:hypothetical protein ILYODFUR_037449, partial [Ilyodon furcidens]